MEAVRTSETSVSIYQTTRRNIPEDSHLHTCRRENLRSQLGSSVFPSLKFADRHVDIVGDMELKNRVASISMLSCRGCMRGGRLPFAAGWLVPPGRQMVCYSKLQDTGERQSLGQMEKDEEDLAGQVVGRR
jgi:hypothetical protein